MTVQLYFTTSSCGAASFISALKAGLIGTKVTPYVIDLASHKVKTGDKAGVDFYTINPKGNVPTIVLEDGTVLNENAATLQWIADQNPEAHLAPANGTSARYLLQSKLSFISSELHGTVGGLFNPNLSAEHRESLVNKYKTKLGFLTKDLTGRKYYVGETFTVADAYLYIVLSWSPYLKFDLTEFPVVQKYFETIAADPVIKAGQAELAKFQ